MVFEPPCTERYARWCERSVGKLITYLLLDFAYIISFRTFHTLQAAPDRNGCWLQSSVFVRTACAASGTIPSFDAQPTLLSFIAHQCNFGSRQTHGDKHRNPARGKRNFWLLFLPWKSNITSVSLILF